MKSVNLAVILLPSSEEECAFSLENTITGIPVLTRLTLVLQRSGIKEILVLSDRLKKSEIETHQKTIEKDYRFTSLLHCHDRVDLFEAESLEQAYSLTQSQPFLLMNANLVTHQQVIQRFVESALNNGSDETFCLDLDSVTLGGIYMLPANKFSILGSPAKIKDSQDKAERITLPADKNFWVEVRDPASASLAEKKLLQYNKHLYHQFMDIWVNSFFSHPISILLVKTPLTPNMLTLFGLPIGLLAGYCFAQGSYLSGLAGGVLLVFTAIWDCCDGDVARLKLMESDFGDRLDTTCDNLINVFVFTGIMLGVSQTHGWLQALLPFIMLTIGGFLIFAFIYFPKGGKGYSFKGSKMYDVIQVLASRNFIYVILLFSIIGRLDWFLWFAGIGSIIFALTLYVTRRKDTHKISSHP